MILAEIAPNYFRSKPTLSRGFCDLKVTVATRGTESRHISLLERDGQPLRVIVPYERGRKVAVLTLRSEADIQVLKNQVSR